jgi:hypothetical protein
MILKDAQQVVDTKKDELRARKMKNAHNKEVLESDEVLIEEAKRVVLISHLLDRFQIMSSSGGDPKPVST